jgi:hypothetical protein
VTRLTIAVCSCIALLLGSPAPGKAAEPPFMVAVSDDGAKSVHLEVAYSRMRLISLAGFNTVRITAQWQEGVEDIADAPLELQELKNAVAAARLHGLEPIIAAYPKVESISPTGTWERGKFTSWLSSLAHHLPVRYFVVGNEPNSGTFWSQPAATSYCKLLARSYYFLKKAGRELDREITVIGGALASKGTQPPLEFIKSCAASYRESGWKYPLMDWFGYHPYGQNASEPPGMAHGDGDLVGMADYTRLTAGLDRAFAGTPQGGNLPIIYLEYGGDSRIPAEKLRLYREAEPASTRAVDEPVQAQHYREAYELASCQLRVRGLSLFLAVDERDLTRWQSGLYYIDETPKQTLALVRPTLRAAQAGTLACPRSPASR